MKVLHVFAFKLTHGSHLLPKGSKIAKKAFVLIFNVKENCPQWGLGCIWELSSDPRNPKLILLLCVLMSRKRNNKNNMVPEGVLGKKECIIT